MSQENKWKDLGNIESFEHMNTIWTPGISLFDFLYILL